MTHPPAAPITAWRRETVYVFQDIRSNPWPDRLALRRFRMENITTVRPSWDGARVGEYPDVLRPLSLDDPSPAGVTAIDVAVNCAPGSYVLMDAAGQPLKLQVADLELPARRVFPFYAGINSFGCLKAYVAMRGLVELCEKPDTYRQDLCDAPQVPQTLKAISLARQFGIEPVKQYVVGCEKMVNDSEDAVKEVMYREGGYKQLVLDNTIASPIIWCGSPPEGEHSYNPSPFFLKEINKLVPPGTLAWCADEPRVKNISHGMPAEVAIARARYVRDHAPNLLPMITTGTMCVETLKEMASQEGDLPIYFVLIQNYDDPTFLSHQKGSYFSCMAQGNCDPKGPISKRTDFPVAVVEGDPIEDFEKSVRLAYANNANFVLYYSLNLNLAKCWEPGGIYNYGGNGDGIALYADQTTGDPMPSVRLLYWHRAQQAVEKEILLTTTPTV